MKLEDKMFTHVDSNNNPAMVNVSEKISSKRSAHARGFIVVTEDVMAQLINGDIQTKKGPVFHTAIIAATMAVKKTSELIPFCHPLLIEGCKLQITPIIDQNSIQIDCTVDITGKTGVEMEALTGVSVAALTIYDMCKAISQQMTISEIKLIKKTGGKSDIK
jgi:cyclic pyranopterin phosphate synthase